MVTTCKDARTTLTKVVADKVYHCVFIYASTIDKEHSRRIAEITNQRTLEMMGVA